MKIYRNSDFKATEWSGGKTTELFIYPSGANFKTGNYDVRISIATVETENSVYTELPGVLRILMPIRGHLKLTHKDHHTAELNAFEQDTFSGDWTTHSEGKVTNFNVMCKNGYSARIEHKKISKDFRKNYTCSNGFLYVLEDVIIVNDTPVHSLEAVHLSTGDQIQAESGTSYIEVVFEKDNVN